MTSTTPLVTYRPGSIFVDSRPTAIYRPLDRHRREIRLLTMDPPFGRGPVEIRCNLETVSMDIHSRPAYIALSYMWGPQPAQLDEHVLIYVNGRRIWPTLNLMLALLYLQRSSEPGTRFWIDALCINQQDDDEKSAQVKMMRLIYSNASEVYAWMTPSRASELAIIKLDEIAKRIRSASNPSRYHSEGLSHLRSLIHDQSNDDICEWLASCFCNHTGLVLGSSKS